MKHAAWLPFLKDIADRGDTVAMSLFRRRDLQVDRKFDLSPVTKADREIEKIARDLANERYPELGICGE